MRWTPGPVFQIEARQVARRWQTYAVRAAFVAALFASLLVVWALSPHPFASRLRLAQLAAIGERFYYALAGTQLALVLLAAPAYTAGSLCLDKARGNLTHLLATDLSAPEILWGKLGARLFPVLGLLLAGLPVLALATLLGGVDPEALFGAFLVALGCALLTSTLALALSAWGRKVHEVLLATYLVEIVALLAWFAWYLPARAFSLGGPPAWLELSNPFWITFARYVVPGRVTIHDYVLFLAGCLALSAFLVIVTALTLRTAVLREAGRPARVRRPRRTPLSWLSPSIDYNPVLWRECRRTRPSRWGRAVILAFAAGSALASFFALLTDRSRDVAAFVNAFQFSLGLLLVSVFSVTSLYEERLRGSLDILLTTPLSSRSIFWGKWLAGFRGVLLVMIFPLVVCLGYRLPDTGLALIDRLAGLVGFALLMLAYGTAVHSLGLALAVWVRRFGTAVGLSVTAHVLACALPVLLLLAVGGGGQRTLAVASPWFAAGQFTADLDRRRSEHVLGLSFAQSVWIGVYTLAAVCLVALTLATFDDCLGRTRNRFPMPRPPRRPRLTAPARK